MSYMDPKEQVIDLKLTSYGKYLLSIGKLKPTFYAFFDDDVIYDSSYAGVTTEGQSAIEPRIQEQTPRFSTQVAYSGRDLEIFSKNPNVVNDLVIGSNFASKDSIYEMAAEQGLIKMQDQPERTEILQQPLGRSNPAKEFAPAWDVGFLKAQLESSIDHFEISKPKGTKIIQIPQLDCNIQYEVNRNSKKYNLKNKPELVLLNDPSNDIEEDIFDPPTEGFLFVGDGTVSVEKDFIMLRIEEANTFFELENFDVELFKIDTIIGRSASETKEVLTPLKFYKDFEDFAEDSIADSVDNTSADYYFDILADSEIPSDIACPLVQNDTPKQIFRSKIFDCEDVILTERDGFLEGIPVDLYNDEDDTKDFCE